MDKLKNKIKKKSSQSQETVFVIYEASTDTVAAPPHMCSGQTGQLSYQFACELEQHLSFPL